MDNALFTRLLTQEESHILDFKQDNYDLLNDPDDKILSGFIKDVISFSNTMRDQTGYIITGVKSELGSSPDLHGTTRFIDEATIQQKVKDKVYPRPKFTISKVDHEGKTFIAYEFPITKYVKPLSPTVKLKGLSPGEIYFRRGSSNSLANGLEVIDINNWLNSLPEPTSEALGEKITDLLGRVNRTDILPSTLISEALNLAKQTGNKGLGSFCISELTGYSQTGYQDEPLFIHRKVRAAITVQEFEFDPHSGLSSDEMMELLLRQEHVFPKDIIYTKNIFELEHIVQDFSNKNGLARIKTSAKKLVPGFTKDLPAYCYVTPKDLTNLVAKIRAKLGVLLTSMAAK